MSRIHEALKKAEQERASEPRPEAGPRAAEAAVVPREAFPPAATESTTKPVPGTETRTGPLTLEGVLASCHQPRWSPDPQMMLFQNSQNHVNGAEEFRTLRSRLYQIREKQPLRTMRTLLVTSALPGEGKTLVAANLAHVIVRQHERRALLIDGDLRWSRLHRLLGAPAAPGLSEYLRGEADEFAVIQRGPQGNLFFIPGGKSVSNPAELIGTGRLKSLVQRLAPIFDWIIVDSPPVIPVSDATLLAEACDGVLIVVRAASTPFDLAQKACHEFRDRHLLGVVFNQVRPGVGYSSYYFKHYPDLQVAKKGKD